jgi:hypothetical protein
MEGSRPHFLATSAISKKWPKVNNHPMGEDSPKLVTLTGNNVEKK